MITAEALQILTDVERAHLITGLPLDVVRKLIGFEKQVLKEKLSYLGASETDDADILRITKEAFIVGRTLDSILYFFDHVHEQQPPTDSIEGDE